jgi:hypothetical protein
MKPLQSLVLVCFLVGCDDKIPGTVGARCLNSGLCDTNYACDPSTKRCVAVPGVTGGGGAAQGGSGGEEMVQIDAATGGGTAISLLRVATDTIAGAYVDSAYMQNLRAQGGVPPYVWSLVPQGALLGWLNIAPSTGALNGTPTALAAAASFTVVVTDSQAQKAQKDFSVSVVSCVDGTTVACTTAINNACVIGLRTCTAGALGACSGVTSTDVSKCGATCDACGVGADSCKAGVCSCGATAACASGETCCGGTCKNLATAASCGACGNNCLLNVGPNVDASCSVGQCVFACRARFQNCTVGTLPRDGCTSNLDTDVANCGSCGNSCEPTNPASVATKECATGQCRITCAPGNFDCDANPKTGCEVPVGPLNCGSCGAKCSTQNAVPSCVGTSPNYACQFACNPGFGDCTGPTDGCETNVSNSITNCGQCGNRCDVGDEELTPGKADSCVAGRCSCGSTPACSFGSICQSGVCVCNAQTCKRGCCSGNVCLDGQEQTSCGSNGAACQSCPKPKKCNVGIIGGGTCG